MIECSGASSLQRTGRLPKVLEPSSLTEMCRDETKGGEGKSRGKDRTGSKEL